MPRRNWWKWFKGKTPLIDIESGSKARGDQGKGTKCKKCGKFLQKLKTILQAS